jgi:hypothetical protein
MKDAASHELLCSICEGLSAGVFNTPFPMYNCPVPYNGPNRKYPNIWNFFNASVDMYSSQNWSDVLVFQV